MLVKPFGWNRSSVSSITKQDLEPTLGVTGSSRVKTNARHTLLPLTGQQYNYRCSEFLLRKAVGPKIPLLTGIAFAPSKPPHPAPPHPTPTAPLTQPPSLLLTRTSLLKFSRWYNIIPIIEFRGVTEKGCPVGLRVAGHWRVDTVVTPAREFLHRGSVTCTVPCAPPGLTFLLHRQTLLLGNVTYSTGSG